MQEQNVADITAPSQNSVIGQDNIWLVYMATAACKGATSDCSECNGCCF
jgi:hypothetical protein